MKGEEIKKKFVELFDTEGKVFTAPGRVNLLGEHTDYNGGYVLPMPINRKIQLVASKRYDNKIELYSVNFNEEYSCDLMNIQKEPVKRWANYTLGVADCFLKAGYKMNGFNALIYGDIPVGSGVSSSAALEVASAMMLKDFFHLRVSEIDLVKITQKAENNFVGVKCGIMDQFVSYFGKKSTLLFLNCKNLEFTNIPFNESKKIGFVVIDTNVRRKLEDSSYNNIGEECREAVSLYNKHFNTDYNDITEMASDNNFKYEFFPERLKKRVLHVISENKRVLTGIDYLRRGEDDQFANLMYESHESLKRVFNVSCKELDSIVDVSLKFKGSLGVKMSGAGFGGIAIALVEKSKVSDYIEFVSSEYLRINGFPCSAFEVESENGGKNF